MKKLKKAAVGILAGALCAASTAGVAVALAPAEARAEVASVQSPNIMTPTKLELNKTYQLNPKADKDGSYFYFTTDSSSKPYIFEINNDFTSTGAVQLDCYEMGTDTDNKQYAFSGIWVGPNDRYQKTYQSTLYSDEGVFKPNCKYMIVLKGGWDINPNNPSANFLVHFKISHESTGTFSDVKKSDWYYAPVEWAAARGITTGANGLFAPFSSCTREHAITFLWRMAGSPYPGNMTSRFRDVKNTNSYSYKAIMWGTDKGIITGSNGVFAPNNTCTREQIVTMLWRLAGEPAPESLSVRFSDMTNKNRYSYKAVMWAAEKGITTGQNGKFAPTKTCTRAEIVTFMYRYKNMV